MIRMLFIELRLFDDHSKWFENYSCWTWNEWVDKNLSTIVLELFSASLQYSYVKGTLV